MTPLESKMAADMRLRSLSERTRDTYLRFVGIFAKHHGRCPSDLGAEEVRAFLLHLDALGRTTSTRNVYWSALRFLYVETLGRPDVFATIPRARLRRRKDPVALTKQEVGRLLSALAAEPFDFTFFATMLATGLRIAETCQLRTDDIDADSGLIRVRRGKGGAPRTVMLSDKHLRLLRRYWKVVRPPGPWLFPAQRQVGPGRIDPNDRFADHAVHTDTMSARFRAHVRGLGFSRRVTPHDLRRTFSTWLLEDGVDLRTLQVLLGHQSPTTTARYAAVNPALIRRTPSGLDLL
jgi:integrase